MLRRLRVGCFAFVLALFAAVPLSTALGAEITTEEINKVLEPIREKYDVPALAAAVVRLDQPTVVGAVGVRKRGDDTPVELDDKFHLGSCTKAMTATLIARLVEQGKLSWDDPLDKLFPDLADKVSDELRSVTLPHLLAHQSGLVDPKIGEWWKLTGKDDITKQRMKVVEQAVTQRPEKAPGTNFHYANINYIVAGAAAERVTGKSWETLIEEELFKPLKMESAGFGTMATPGKTDQPWSHDGRGKPLEPGLRGDNPPLLGPAGRVHCSLADWAAYAEKTLRGTKQDTPLLKRESYKLLHTPEFKGSGYARGGWGLGGTPKGLALMHDGSNTLNYSSAVIVPSEDFAVLTACNQGQGEGGENRGGGACTEARQALFLMVLKAKAAEKKSQP